MHLKKYNTILILNYIVKHAIIITQIFSIFVLIVNISLASIDRLYYITLLGMYQQ